MEKYYGKYGGQYVPRKCIKGIKFFRRGIYKI